MAVDIPTYNIEENESGQYTALITGNDGQFLPGSTLTTLLLTVYAINADGTDFVIRNQQNVLNLNNVTVADTTTARANGTVYNLVWLIRPTDTIIHNDALRFERHICLF